MADELIELGGTSSENKQPTVDEKYEMLSDIDHVLLRPDMYVGTTTTVVKSTILYKPSDNKILNIDGCYVNVAVLKFFDEVLTNSVDEARRKTRLFDVNRISVVANKNGFISVTDNGGIPVQIHSKYKIYIPFMIFGVLRTSTNYQKDQTRNGAGLNGLGAKLTNIFSKEFRVQTADGKKSCDITWSNNMREHTEPVVKKCNTHGTTISFTLDLDRLDMNEVNLSMIRLFQKRCIDAAAANTGMIIDFKSDAVDGKLDSTWEFNNFNEYINLYLTEEQRTNKIEHLNLANMRDKYVVVPVDEKSNGVRNVGFVNGANCNEGTHITKIRKQITTKILEILKEKDIELITEKDINNRICVFCSTSVPDPVYDSQTKDELTSVIDKYSLILPKEFLAKFENSEIVNELIDYYKTKYEVEQKKALRKLNNAIKATKSKKLIDCVATNALVKELWLFEGNSAASGFRNYRNPQTQSAYLLRGKIKNTFTLSKEQILENVELREILAALGIQFNDPKNNVKNCKYAKIIIDTDQDFDGHHICGLLLAFFGKHFPELFKARKIFRAMSPVIIATKDKQDDLYYYNQSDYDNDSKAGKLKGYDIIFTKGLGGLRDQDYSTMLQQQKLIMFTLDDVKDMKSVDVWFNKSTDQRKNLLMADGITTED